MPTRQLHIATRIPSRSPPVPQDDHPAVGSITLQAHPRDRHARRGAASHPELEFCVTHEEWRDTISTCFVQPAPMISGKLRTPDPCSNMNPVPFFGALPSDAEVMHVDACLTCCQVGERRFPVKGAWKRSN